MLPNTNTAQRQYSPWPLINLESGSTNPRVTVRDLAGVLGHLSGPMGAPSDRKEPGTDPDILHSGPTCCMYMQLHSDLHAWVQKGNISAPRAL